MKYRLAPALFLGLCRFLCGPITYKIGFYIGNHYIFIIAYFFVGANHLLCENWVFSTKLGKEWAPTVCGLQ